MGKKKINSISVLDDFFRTTSPTAVNDKLKSILSKDDYDKLMKIGEDKCVNSVKKE